MHAHTQPNTHTMSLSVLGCDRPMALARYVNYVCRAIHHACTFPPETGTFVWSTHLLSPSFDSARPNLFPHSWVGGFISTYVLFFIFPSLWANVLVKTWACCHKERDCELQFGDTGGPYRLWPGLANKHCREVKQQMRKRKDLWHDARIWWSGY